MCIDPQQQALNWIKKKEQNNNLKVQKDLILAHVSGSLLQVAHWTLKGRPDIMIIDLVPGLIFQ